MSDTLTAALISAGVGLVVGLVPFLYRWKKDREEARERARETGRLARAEAERRQAEKRREQERKTSEARRELEQQRERRATVAKTYLALLGNVMALLDVLRVDAVNADDLLKHVSEANAELQGFAQGDLVVTFGAQSPVVWADRACRQIIRKALDLAHNARANHHEGERAVQTQNEIRTLTAGHIDYGGPRDLMRWATEAAVAQWPEPLISFEEHEDLADHVAFLAELEPFRPSVAPTPRTSGP
jgi:hypothetical protein